MFLDMTIHFFLCVTRQLQPQICVCVPFRASISEAGVVPISTIVLNSELCKFNGKAPTACVLVSKVSVEICLSFS
jgi:hypothetical protein